MHDGIERLERAVRAHAQEPGVAQQHIQVHNLFNVSLPMVAQNHDIRLLKRPLAPERLQQAAKLLVVLAQLVRHVLVAQAVLMAAAV